MKKATNKTKRKKLSHLAKLTPSEVRHIRRLAGKGQSQPSLAKQFKVSQSSIHNLIWHKTYAWV